MNHTLAKFANMNVRKFDTSYGRGPVDDMVTVTRSTEGGKRYVVRVSLHKTAMKQLGWQLGDKINITITDEGKIHMYRDNNAGLVCGGSHNSTRKYIRFSVIKEFYEAIRPGAGRDVSIGNGGIVFSL